MGSKVKNSPSKNRKVVQSFDSAYLSPLLISIIIQIVVLGFGLLHPFWAIAAACSVFLYWLVFIFVLLRYPFSPPEWDLRYVRSGFLFIFPFVLLLTGCLR